MASMWRRAMHYLGLGPDEDYDDYDLLGGSDQEPPRRDAATREPGPRDGAPREPGRRRPMAPGSDPDAPSTVRTLSSSGRAPASSDSGMRPPPAVNGHTSRGPGGERHPQGRGSGPQRPAIVRPLAVPPSAKPHVVSPAAFTDAQEVADHFKRNAPVIVNLQGVERDLMRRIIDFASGLCYGLGGQMERVANHVYLLTPSDVEVSPEERRRLRERGYEA